MDLKWLKKNLDLDIHGFDVRGSLTISNCKAFFLTNKFHYYIYFIFITLLH